MNLTESGCAGQTRDKIKMNQLPRSIIDLSLDELKEFAVSIGEKPFRAKQIAQWLYVKHAASFEDMTNIPVPLRSVLHDYFTISPLTEEKKLMSPDGTTKFLFRLFDGLFIESVLIPDDNDRTTLCVSSQAGCPLGCRFCKTGAGGYKRNLEHGEIVGQLIHASRALPEGEKVSNIVFMGMGEPFLNYKTVVRSLETITSSDCFAMSPSRITVSTSGITDRIEEFGELGLAGLAISLNASTNTLRSEIMPINKKHPISTLMKAVREYPTGRLGKITFEYVLLAGVNDSDKNADSLIRLISGTMCKINLIPFNESPGIPYRRPTRAVVERFRNRLVAKGFDVYTRVSRGVEISAACGQLAGDTA